MLTSKLRFGILYASPSVFEHGTDTTFPPRHSNCSATFIALALPAFHIRHDYRNFRQNYTFFVMLKFTVDEKTDCEHLRNDRFVLRFSVSRQQRLSSHGACFNSVEVLKYAGPFVQWVKQTRASMLRLPGARDTGRRTSSSVSACRDTLLQLLAQHLSCYLLPHRRRRRRQVRTRST